MLSLLLHDHAKTICYEEKFTKGIIYNTINKYKHDYYGATRQSGKRSAHL